MSLRSWLRQLYGMAQRVEPLPPMASPQETPLDRQQPERPGSNSPVLQAVLKQATMPPAVQEALTAYRTEVQRLVGCGGASYRAGALEAAQQVLQQAPLPPSLGTTTLILQELFADCADLVFRALLIGGQRPALLIYIDGLVQAERLELSVLQPLTNWGDPDRLPGDSQHVPMWLEAIATAIGETSPVKTVGEVIDGVLAGDGVLLVDGVNQGMKLGIPGWEKRSIEEPVSEAYIRGPREGFIETVRTNTTMVRRKLRTPHLKMEQLVIGRRTRTTLQLLYLKDIASPAVVAEMRRRLQQVQTDGIEDAGMLEEFLEDQPTSLFPQLMSTERPDRVVAALLEGQVVVLVDGSPFALIAPATFWNFLVAGEDYYERFWVSSFLAWLRMLFFMIALTGPSLYVAITTYHPEMLPTGLLLTLAAAREGIPFPALVEVFMLEIFFEALREAGVRLPRPVGQAVSIVGALVIGEAAVRAGLASAPVVIIVAATGISSFTFPSYSLGVAFRLLRFPLMVLAGSLGLFGLVVGQIAVLLHLCALRSFGVPYLQPLTPLDWRGLKDVLIRAPIWLMNRRQPGLGQVNPNRSPSRPAQGGRS